jgi:hypothetical protein
VLHALGGSAYDKEFITALSSELSFVAETVDKLRLNRVTELTLRSLSRLELQQIFNITLNDAVMISAWCSARLKEEEKAERARLKEEEKAERARLKQQKLEQSKHLRIFNEADGEYSDISIPDQNSLQTYLSGSRISALRLVDASRTSSLLIMTWDSLVNNSCYAHPGKVREAIDVLTGELYKEEKRNAEHGSCRRLSSHFHTEFDYLGSDIKMKSKRGRDLGDIDTMYISKDRSRLVLLERKRSGSANASSSVASPLSPANFFVGSDGLPLWRHHINKRWLPKGSTPGSVSATHPSWGVVARRQPRPRTSKPQQPAG